MHGEFILKVAEWRARLATTAGIAATAGSLGVMVVAVLAVARARPHQKST